MDYMEFLGIAIFVLVAASVSLLFRLWDYPETKADETKGETLGLIVFKTYIGAVIAVAMSVWVLLYANPDIELINPVNFALMASAGIGGMATFRGLLGKLAPGAGI